MTVWGGSNPPSNVCGPTRIADDTVWVQADGNTPVASTVVKVRAQ